MTQRLMLGHYLMERVNKIAHSRLTAGKPLEIYIPTLSSNILMGEVNHFDMVKIINIGQSAAKYPIKDKGSTTIP